MITRRSGGFPQGVLAQGRTPSAHLRTLLGCDDDIFRSHLFEAAKLLGDGATLPPVLRTVVLRELREIVRNVPHQSLQKEAIGRLRQVGGPAVATILASLATNSELTLQVRQCALGELRLNGCDEALATNLAHDEDMARHPILVVELAWLLARQGYAAQAVELLLRVGRSRTFNREARARLAECCGEIPLPGLHVRLLNILRDPTLNRDIHTSVAHLLLLVAPAPPVSDIVTLFTDRRIDAVIRRDIAEAVGQITDRELPKRLLDLIRLPTIHAGVRARLALTLGALRRSEVAEDIVQLLYDSTLDVGLRSRLASALGPLKANHLAKSVITMVWDQKLELPIRRSLARTLGLFDDPSLKKEVRKLLRDGTIDIGVQARLARSLVSLGDTDVAVRAMSRLAHDQHFHSFVRARIVRELNEVGHPDTVSFLRGLLDEGPASGPLRREILVGLARAGQSDVVEELLGYVHQRTLSAEVRREMIDALAQVGDGSVEILIELLTDRFLDGRLRQLVAERLAPCCGPTEVPRIIAIVEDTRQDLAVRVDAGRVLGIVGDSAEAVRALCRLLSEVSNKYGPVYGALLAVCRRAGVSVFPESVGWPPVRYLS